MSTDSTKRVCPACGRNFMVPSRLAAKPVKCPNIRCGTTVQATGFDGNKGGSGPGVEPMGGGSATFPKLRPKAPVGPAPKPTKKMPILIGVGSFLVIGGIVAAIVIGLKTEWGDGLKPDANKGKGNLRNNNGTNPPDGKSKTSNVSLLDMPLKDMVGKVVPGFLVTKDGALHERFVIGAPFSLSEVSRMSDLEKNHVIKLKDNFYAMELGGGSGTGFLISENGYMLTNQHVVEDIAEAKDNPGLLSKIRLKTKVQSIEPVVWVFFDGKPQRARIIHVSENYDMAVLKVNGFSGKKHFKLSASAELKQASDIFVLGYPGAADAPVTEEEAKAQETRIKNILNIKKITEAFTENQLIMNANKGVVGKVSDRKGLGKVIQYDVATNPGNSGGPATTTNGVVWGIHSWGFKKGAQINAAGLILPMRGEIDSALGAESKKISWVTP